MKENETIELLNLIRMTANDLGVKERVSNFEETFQTAIETLKEIQQYRATGMTPQQIKEMQRDYVVKSQLFEEYKNIGTIDKCKEAVKKQLAKRPLCIRSTDSNTLFDCPGCGYTQKIVFNGFYCKLCGQKLDWED